MALNVSYVQYQSMGIDTQSIKSVANEILSRATLKNASNNNQQQKAITLGIDLYNQSTSSATAKQVAVSNAGLQVTLNNNLKTTLQFLNVKAATQNNKPMYNSSIKSMSTNKDKDGSNPFYNGELRQGKKNETSKKEEYLFIK